ncbi:MAG: tRNA pseudouridine synthase A [Thermoplasmata archaeon]
MARWLVSFGYDGLPFAGWARQPGLRTVEGEIRAGLVRCGEASRPEEVNLEVASRTDRGVSARANALLLTSRFGGDALLGVLNAIAPEIFFSGAAEVPDGFRARAARWREYRYFLRPEEPGLRSWPEWLPWFTGSPIDVRSFARGIDREGPTLRSIDAIELTEGIGGAVLRLQASGFLWGMVRKIVSALRATGSGAVAPGALRAALAGRVRLAFPLAPPEPLVLWQVEHGVAWTHRPARWSRRQAGYFAEELARARARSEVLPTLLPPAP